MPVSNKIFSEANPYSGNMAIYIHWPFCQKKCPYCDFNSHVRATIDHSLWLESYLKELNWFKEKFPNASAGSIFFGGGTPSLMEAKTVARLIEEVRRLWPHKDTIEITLEANPSSVEAARFRDYKSAGINRISVGIQSFHDEELKFLGRLHNAYEGFKALDIAQSTFDRVSFDLIYALPDHTAEQWKATLEKALSLGTSHLSLYQLTIEEGTAFHHQYARGQFTLPDEDTCADLYNLTQDLTNTAGMPAYEISNHARHGQESKHNLYYWKSLPFVGIGPGAHGRLPGINTGESIAHMQIKRPEEWLKSVKTNNCGIASLNTVSSNERAEEALIMGLRLKQGIDCHEFLSIINKPVSSFLDMDQILFYQNEGYISFDGNTLKLTRKGFPLLNSIIARVVV